MGISINNVEKKFGKNRVILNSINFEIKDNEFVCILGPSGCGKSTLLKILAGLDFPTTGTVYVDEKRIMKPSNERVMMFQEVALFPWLTVIENIKFGLKMKNMTNLEQKEIAKKYLKLVKLEEFEDYHIHKLSGGMQQRVALARALAIESRFILMDEPFSSLDKQTINVLREELQNIFSTLNTTIIYVTHSVEEAIFFADRIIMLSACPSTIKNVFEIMLPRPRKIDDINFNKLRNEILQELRFEVNINEKNVNI